MVYRYEVEAEDGSGIGKANRGDDALLFASAPDLLAACKAAVGQIEPIGEYAQEAIERLTAAIAKAEGGQP